MAATPSDIARYTVDGIVVISPGDPNISAEIKENFIDARGDNTTEREMFFVDPNHAAIMLNETFSYLSEVNPTHVGIQLEDTLDIGGLIPLTPQVPSWRVTDDDNAVDQVARTRAYAYDMDTDRYQIEVLA